MFQLVYEPGKFTLSKKSFLENLLWICSVVQSILFFCYTEKPVQVNNIWRAFGVQFVKTAKD